MSNIFEQFFRIGMQDEVSGEDIDRAKGVVEFASTDHYRNFIDWLDDEAARPIDSRSAHGDLIASATRANVLREIRAKLKSDTARAERLLAEARKEQRIG